MAGALIDMPALSPRNAHPFRYVLGMLVAWMAAIEIASEPYAMDGLSRFVLFGTMALPFLALTAFIFSIAIKRMTHRFHPRRVTRWLRISTVVVVFILIVNTANESRPVRFFERISRHRALASMSNLQVRRSSTFGEGDAWFFRFDTVRADLDGLIRDCDFAALDDSLDRAEIVEEYVKRTVQDLYSRPKHAQTYFRDNTILITNEDHTVANLFIDRFVDEPIKRMLSSTRLNGKP